MIAIVPKTARPTRHVSPTILPLRLRIAEMRWSVRSMPARLSSPNDADVVDDIGDVVLVDLAVGQDLLPAAPEARLG